MIYERRQVVLVFATRGRKISGEIGVRPDATSGALGARSAEHRRTRPRRHTMTKSVSLSLLLSALLAAAAVLTAPAASSAGAPLPTRIDRTLDDFLRAHPSFPGVALAVRTPGLEWAGAAGVADRTSKTPLTADATFRIASLMKTFTAAATLRLAEEGK